MSEPILPLRQWPSGIQQASVPANDNALRLEALSRPCLGVSNDASGSDADGDVWLVGSAPTGAFAAFTENDIALYHVDPDTAVAGWYAWAPVDGLKLVVDGVRKVYVGGSTNEWQDDSSGGGGIPDAPSDGTTYGRKDGAWTAVTGGGSGTDLGWFDVTTYGATGDGVTDDTVAIQAAIDAAAAAGGGAVFFPSGEYVVAGALQDTSNANAQLLLPSIDVLTGDQITIELRGPFAPTPDISVIGDIPVAMSGAVIRSTLASGSGGNLIGVKGPSGSAGGFSNILAHVENLTIRMPSNTTHSAVDLRYAACATVDNVVIDTGSYYIQGLPEPTTAGSYGLRMPTKNNGAMVRLGTVNVVGFYNGFEFAEHANGYACQAAWGCKRAFVFTEAEYHASVFQRLMPVHCERGIVATAVHYVDITQLNVEHAASGWWVTDFDIDDASSYLRGTVRWHAILAGSGVSSTFTVNGAARMNITRLGWENRVEQVSVSADVTFEGRHANKHILHPSADTTARTWTIPANASVPYPIGTTLTFVNQNAAGALTIAITTDTMRLAGAGTTGSRTLAANGIATAIKTTATEWQINGTGLT